jgi:hypothetical protein
MRQILLFILLSMLSFICLTGFYFALTDWLWDVATGVYAHNFTEAALETSALLVYTYLAVRFLKKKITLL